MLSSSPALLMNGIVTVAIPVLNGARYLDEVLSAVRAQRVDREVELLIVDSGSTDGSLEIARRHGARIHEIPKSEFSHGGTRNLIMELARGDHVAFLTQDATPASDGWLAALLEGFELADDVAAVFGPHDVRPGSSHMIEAEMERHFANWGGGREIDVQRLDRSPTGLAAYRAEPWRFTFLSSVNCALARWAWEQVPFRDVPYAEDQLLGRELIEAGYAKVFHPDARVLHSHDFPPHRFFRRYFDEFRGLREVLGHREPAGIERVALLPEPRRGRPEVAPRARRARPTARQEALALPTPPRGPAGRGDPRLARGPAAGRGCGAGSRSRAADTFEPVDVPPSRLLVRQRNASRSTPTGAGSSFARRGSGKVEADPHLPRPPGGPLTLAWVIPPWRVGSGGHAAIFQLLRGLEELGHSCAVYVFDPFHNDDRPAHVAEGGDSRALRPARRRGVRRPGRLRLSRRRDRDELVDGLSRPRPAALQARRSTSSRITSPSSTRRPSSRSGRSRPTRWATGASRTRPGSPAFSESGTGSRSRSSTWVPTSRPTRRPVRRRESRG